jgi:hypothetical protein
MLRTLVAFALEVAMVNLATLLVLMTAIWSGVEWDALDREESIILSGLIVKKQLYCHVYREEAIALLKHTGVSYCLKAIPGLESANLTLAHFNDWRHLFLLLFAFLLTFYMVR